MPQPAAPPLNPGAPPPIAPAPGDGSEIVGNGQSARDVRPIADFTRVANRTSLDVHVTQGAAFMVAVTADANIVPVITTTVSNGVLVVASDRSFQTRVPSSVDITLTRFEGADNLGSGGLSVAVTSADAIALTNRGSGNLTFNGQSGPVALQLGGSGSTTLTGSGGMLTGSSSGSGQLSASAFPVAGATFSAAGSGSANLTVRGNAQLRLVGSGSIQAALDQGTADLSVIGSGSIVWSGSAVVSASNTVGSGSIVHRP